MSSSSRYRMHMGCGESLQSRWWVTRLRRASLPGERGSREEPVKKPDAPASPGAKRKS